MGIYLCVSLFLLLISMVCLSFVMQDKKQVFLFFSSDMMRNSSKLDILVKFLTKNCFRVVILFKINFVPVLKNGFLNWTFRVISVVLHNMLLSLEENYTSGCSIDLAMKFKPVWNHAMAPFCIIVFLFLSDLHNYMLLLFYFY